jgi:hypothetical protein
MVKGNTYDFTFTMVPPLTGSVTSAQVEAQAHLVVGSVPELIQYQLYSGTPGSGTFIAQSSLDYSPVLGFDASPGDYYVEITSKEIAKSGEVSSGSVNTTGVPEPASWAIMLLGLGGVGAALRRRPRPLRAFAR